MLGLSVRRLSDSESDPDDEDYVPEMMDVLDQPLAERWKKDL